MVSFKTTVLAAATLFGATFAAPGLLPLGDEGTKSSGPTVSEVQAQQCGNGQVVSCCNSKNEADGLVAIAGSILGGDCQPIIAALIQVPVSQACGGAQAACCTGDQNGLVNVQCNNILV